MRTSTGKPTKAESDRIVACKEGPCQACMVWVESGRAPHGFNPVIGCDYHHTLSGGRRRGHRYGLALCPHHHRAIPDFGCTQKEMREWYGPSLMDGSKVFAAIYGSDNELLERQDREIGWPELVA